MAKERGKRLRKEYINTTDGVQMSPSKGYIRLSDWSIDVPTFVKIAENGFLLPNKNPKDKSHGRRYGTHNDQTFKVNGLRLSTFKLKGVTCAECGVVGEIFHLEKPLPREPFHLNLYGFKNGNEVMLTQDHIRPKSRGGKNCIDNSQTMCKQCNESKGNTWFFDLVVGEEYFFIEDYKTIMPATIVEIVNDSYVLDFGLTSYTFSKFSLETLCKENKLAMNYAHAEECLRLTLHGEVRKKRAEIVSLLNDVSASNKRTNDYHIQRKEEKQLEPA